MKAKRIVLKQLVFIALLLCGKCFAQTVPAKILGTYWSPKKDAKIEIYQKGTQYFGKTIWAAVPRKDVNNPDKSLKPKKPAGN